MPERIQRKRTKGWKMPNGAVYVGRPTIFGNPFTSDNPAEAVQAYRVIVGLDRQYNGSLVSIIDPDKPLVYQPMFEAKVRELRGKDLACWCPLEDEDGNSVPCHADVLLELANTPVEDVK